VTGCGSQGELIGAYVLGALEPDEMDDVRRHLAGCSRCAAEERRLAGIPALLELAHADAQVPLPSPGLEEQVLDRFVTDRAAHAPERPRRRRTLRLAIPVVAAVALALTIALVILLPADAERAYARAELWSNGRSTGSAAVTAVDAGTHVKLRAQGLPVRRGMVYELWCVRTDGRWVAGGSFRARSDGTAAAELTAAVRPGEYHLVVVTRRTGHGDHGREVMRGELVY
jgi:hypothetical protein